MAEPRNHHYLPQCYLRGFAQGVKRQARVRVIDLTRDSSFSTLVRNVGGRRDFNRIEVSEDQKSLDPNFVEKAFGAGFEADLAPALARVIETASMPTDRDKETVVSLAALIAIRNPKMRTNVGGFVSEIAKSVAEMSVQSQERWEGIQERMRAKDIFGNPRVTFEEMQNFVQRGEYEVVPSNNLHVGLEMEIWQTVTDLLFQRRWDMLVAPEEHAFIASDHPTILRFIDTREDRGIFNSPGFGVAGTEVLFPVSSSLCLRGVFEEGDDATIPVNEITVARLNSEQMNYAEHQVFGRDDDFLYLGTGGLRRGNTLLRDPATAERNARRAQRSGNPVDDAGDL